MEKNREASRTAGKEKDLAGRGRESRRDRNGRKEDAGGKPGKFFFPLVILLAFLVAVFAVGMALSGGGKSWNQEHGAAASGRKREPGKRKKTGKTRCPAGISIFRVWRMP